jgi:hypothetical protein
MLISSFESIDDLNKWYQSLFSSKNNLIPFNNTVLNIINNNLYNVARAYIANDQLHLDEGNFSTPSLYDELIRYIEVHNSSKYLDTISYQEYSEDYMETYEDFYYFPFTKSSFVSTFLPSFLPSFSDKFISLLKQHDCLIQYGPGLGTAFAIKQIDLRSLGIKIEDVNTNFDYRIYKNFFDQFFSIYESREKDFLFLSSQNQQLIQKIDDLESTILSLQEQLENYSLTTWA